MITSLLIALIFNAIVGYLLFNWAWKQLQPVINQDLTRDNKFSAFKRLDVSKWKKSKFVLGAITIMPIRFIIGLWVNLSLFAFVKIVGFGHNFDIDQPLSGKRKVVIAIIFKIFSIILLRLGLAIKVERKIVDFDYSEYLGKDYKLTQKDIKFVSTFISNHVSWTDIIVFINQYQPAFAAKKELGRIPVFGLLCKALGCIFIARSASQDVRDQTIQQIGERQQLIQKEGRFPPIVVFAEGGTSNGSSILGFKKGAFSALLPVRPIVLKYESPMFHNAYDIIPFLPMFIMQSCVTDFTCTVQELPPFIPNEYLFQKFESTGKEKWEIYADAVRDVMSKASGLPLTNLQQKDKISYQIALGYKSEKDFKRD